VNEEVSVWDLFERILFLKTFEIFIKIIHVYDSAVKEDRSF